MQKVVTPNTWGDNDIPVATHNNRFFSEPSTTTQNWLFSQRKNATNLQSDEKVLQFTS